MLRDRNGPRFSISTLGQSLSKAIEAESCGCDAVTFCPPGSRLADPYERNGGRWPVEKERRERAEVRAKRNKK